MTRRTGAREASMMDDTHVLGRSGKEHDRRRATEDPWRRMEKEFLVVEDELGIAR